MRKFFIITTLTFLLSLGFLLAGEINKPVFAAETDLKNTTFEVNKFLKLPTQQDSSYFEDKNYSPLVSFVIRVIDFATKIMGAIAMLLFIIAGFMFMVAQGNQQQIDNAKEVFKFALIGLLVTFFSYTIILLLQTIFAQP